MSSTYISNRVVLVPLGSQCTNNLIMKTVRVVVMTNVKRKYESCSNVGNSMNSGDSIVP